MKDLEQAQMSKFQMCLLLDMKQEQMIYMEQAQMSKFQMCLLLDKNSTDELNGAGTNVEVSNLPAT